MLLCDSNKNNVQNGRKWFNDQLICSLKGHVTKKDGIEVRPGLYFIKIRIWLSLTKEQ